MDCIPYIAEKSNYLTINRRIRLATLVQSRDVKRSRRSRRRPSVRIVLCKSRMSERASGRSRERASERASRRLWLLPALSHPFTDYGAVAKNVRLAVTVCRQNLPFRLAFSTCENKSLSRFSYRSGERPPEWGDRTGRQRVGRGQK